jgi:hypothetical protein
VDNLEEDFTRIVGGAPARLWFIHTMRPGHWRRVGRDEPGIVAELLSARGCAPDGGASFHNVAVKLYRCGR